MDITPEVIARFRTAVTAFGDSTKWVDDTIAEALNEADAETGGRGWGAYDDDPQNFKQRGMFAYAAHYLATTYPKGSDVMSAGAKQAVVSKSVGDESVSYASNGVNNLSAGDSWFGTSAFGQKFLRLRKRAGMGARAV